MYIYYDCTVYTVIRTCVSFQVAVRDGYKDRMSFERPSPVVQEKNAAGVALKKVLFFPQA